MAGKQFLDSLKCLSESDKNRMICILLHSTFQTNQIDWETATSVFGATSKSSMQRMYHAARQKYRENNGVAGPESPNKKVMQQATKGKGGKGAGGAGKRKKVNSDDDDESDGSEQEDKKAPGKKRGRKAKTPTTTSAAKGRKGKSSEVKVKDEPSDDGEDKGKAEGSEGKIEQDEEENVV